jgi:hypothetical protein
MDPKPDNPSRVHGLDSKANENIIFSGFGFSLALANLDEHRDILRKIVAQYINSK